MTLLKRITINQLMSWNPCPDYRNEQYLLKLTGGRRSLTPLQVTALDIPIKDRLWPLLRPEVIHELRLHLLGCDFAEHILPVWERWYCHDRRPRIAIETKRLWVAGKATNEELREARLAVVNAERAALRAKQKAAAKVARAAWWAARVAWAAWAATKAALEATEDTAAERRWQLDRVIEVLHVA